MQKSAYVLIILFMSLFCINTDNTTINAAEVNNSQEIKIDSESFPDDIVRKIISKDFDENRDGYLSPKEVNTANGLYLDVAEVQDEEKMNNKKYYLSLSKQEKYNRYGIIDCKGLEIFKKFTGMTISLGGVKGYKSKILNFESLKLLKLERLYLIGDSGISNYNFSLLPSLKKLEMIDCSNVKSVKFGKKSKIENLNLTWTSGKAHIDVSKLKRLKKFKSEFTGLKKITFGKNNKNLTSICIKGNPLKTNRKIKKLDFSKLKKLQKIDIWDLDALNSVKFGNNKKLKKVTISSCNKLKKINVKGCKIPKKLKIGTEAEVIR